MLKTALVGLPLVGKTTVFNLLTQKGAATSPYGSGRVEAERAVAEVPDPRIDALVEMYHPRKRTPATVEYVDVPGLVRGASQGEGMGNRFLADVREVDALVQVLRLWDSEEVPHPEGSINPVRDMETVELELLMADLDLLSKRAERIRSGKKVKKENEEELALVTRCVEALSEGRHLSQLSFSEEEARLLRNYSLLTEKPVLLVANLPETLTPARAEDLQHLREAAAERGWPLMELSARIEEEIMGLPEEERIPFLAELGIEETGIARLARETYRHLGLISFLTAGEDEVRAWTIRQGISAKEAAGKIHSDIERGFIRAEVVSFDHLNEAGSMAKAREKGWVRLEGKEYTVQDGDIINFRFNV